MVRTGLAASVFCLFLVISTVGAQAQGAKQYSVASMIVEVEGAACLGQEHSRAETKKLALTEAKRTASEWAVTHVTSETNVKDGKLADDLINAYSRATVRILEELEKGWQQSDGSGGFVDSCYRVKIKAEVVPAKVENVRPVAQAAINNPRAPLTVELWTDKETYGIGDAMKFYFRGNKPFYARAVYKDAEGNLIEVTRARDARYYRGGTVYEIPGDNDRFTLMITPPLGNEKLILYTSTQPMDNYNGQTSGKWFIVSGNYGDLGVMTRGLTVLEGIQGGGNAGNAEFAEAEVNVRVK